MAGIEAIYCQAGPRALEQLYSYHPMLDSPAYAVLLGLAVILVASACRQVQAPAPSRAEPIERGIPGTQGGPCTRDGSCEPLLRCDEGSRRCVIDESVGTAYGPCYPNGTCNGTLICRVEIDTCAPRPDLGEEGGPCYGNDTCARGFSCIDHRCAVPPAPVP